MKDELSVALCKVDSRENLAIFISLLLKDLSESPEGWENSDLQSFLEAMSAWVEELDGYYDNKGEPIPEGRPWRLFAEILCGAKMYE